MKTKVLMVCLGNICRSPLAEGLLKSKVDTSQIYVTSAGTGSWHVGEQPDPRSIAVAKKNGLDITDQRGRQFKAGDFNEFDHIFVMDNSNKANVLKLAKTDADTEKVQLILDEIFPGENVDVPDPYYGGDSGFDNVYDMLNEACEKIANRI
ncbi:low molecular weight phosphotyrosine protein phosphatase [Marixanthomonas sp. SCSIO 43207]|uniref:low molecular weight protein-tyrosine-phosphatase n=1 Tax=Marixanthomonas sp. SCSIO 43207 TaxID=2779360 RepID=UPI001CA9DFE8|nr:low molecular weight protein-tyrosine-phosphatase [Marixanthomonas sp. SCSIO 43207]UAB81180.1 low molecular weight phosphotyrosine protein phosphatase [Marixanthomonas sp. SCSIO 43207]